MKIASAYSLLLASLCILPSAHAAVRGRSLVRGASAHTHHRLLQKDSKDGDDEDEVEIEEEEESPIAPKKRDCRTKTEVNGVTFECKATTDEANAKVKDEIDYVVATSEKGLMVKIKYEQEIEVEEGDQEAETEDEDIEDVETEGDDVEEAESEGVDVESEGENVEVEDSEMQQEDEETTDPPVDDETTEPPADEEMTEPPVDEDKKESENLEDQDGGEEESEVAPEAESIEGERALQAEQETETQFEVIYDSIIEYSKGAGSTTGEAYDWENDLVLQTISLNTWDVISEVASDGQTSTFSVTSPDGTITFTFTINQAATGQHVTANKMKIDFELMDFPWTSDDSFVALLSTVETERKVDVEYKKGQEAEGEMAPKDVFISFADVADTSSFTPFGKYSWAETADATSSTGSIDQTNTMPSNASTVEEDTMVEVPINETDITTARSANTTASATSAQTPQTIKVVATSPLVERADRRAQEGKQIESIAYSFVGGDAAHRASRIYWDPSAGVDYQSSARPVSLAMAGAGVVLALLALF